MRAIDLVRAELRRWLPTAASIVLLLAIGCGGGGEEPEATATAQPTAAAAPSPTPPLTAETLAFIRGRP